MYTSEKIPGIKKYTKFALIPPICYTVGTFFMRGYSMKVVGIIAEYNPFHNGHKYQIEQIREKTGADYVIVAMSGNFLQRGVPALCDKHSRAKMALECGADLVFELPTIWATASAEYFAGGGVATLASTGVVTHLGFGAETDDLDSLLQVSSILKEEPDVYRAVLGNSIRSGNAFPVARKNALITSLPHFPKEKLDDLLDSPNNILALEYLKALPNNITPILIPRKGAGYHDTDIDHTLPSASAIREAIAMPETERDLEKIAAAMPEEAYNILLPLLENHALLENDDFSEMLGYCLLSLQHHGYSDFADCTNDFSNKILKNLKGYVSVNAFTEKLKSKDMTYTRVSRNLLHILLGIKQADYSIGKAIGYISYLRVLGFREESKPLLTKIKKTASVPIITKVADASTKLDYGTYKMFEKDLFASSLYYQTLARKSNQAPMNEFTNQIVIL